MSNGNIEEKKAYSVKEDVSFHSFYVFWSKLYTLDTPYIYKHTEKENSSKYARFMLHTKCFEWDRETQCIAHAIATL